MISQITIAASLALSIVSGPISTTGQGKDEALKLLNATQSPQAYYMTCFLQGEKTSGMNKICFYDCMGSEAAITIGAVELCPLTIDR